MKSGETLHPEYFRGLRAIAEDFPEINLYLVYGWKLAHRKGGRIHCLPQTDFLKRLRPDQSFSEAMAGNGTIFQRQL
ncbi:MAG: hypothetical protein LBT98_00095 [Puniceicoccales bacterium]|nr:hypothetical protein [Puniceicoccales bacterium]